MVVGIFSNISRDINGEVAKVVREYINNHGSVALQNEDFSNVDIIITIGGDGTLLSAISKYRYLNVPFVGINKGSIGFLTEIEMDRLEEALDCILAGQYKIIERSQIYCEIFDKDGHLKDSSICLNDAVVSRGSDLHVVKMDLYINGSPVEHFVGDGLIISTATGSTAYSLAAGGPILTPGMEDMIITPLCPHTLHRSSYVIDKNSVVEVRFGYFESTPIISPDGRRMTDLEPNDIIKISKYDAKIKTIDLGFKDFYQKVSEKIAARGSFYENGKK